MLKGFKRAFAFSVAMSALFLCSCEEKTKSDSYRTLELFAMDTVISIKAYGNNADSALSSVQSEILRLEKLISVTDENSEIYRLNTQKSLYVSDDVFEIISTSLDISEACDGAFDISVYPLIKLYGFTSKEYHVPTQSEIDNALNFIGYDKISVYNNSVSLDDNAEIDLGGVAKGYCADKIADILRENGVSSAVISLGGNVRLLGQKNDNSNFSIAISDPNDTSKYIGYIEASDCSIVTSGSYQRYFDENGTRYHHIINPKTGFCADNGLLSVTVICENGTYADALSTAFFVMGKERTIEFCKKNPEFSAILVDDKGEICTVGDVDFTPNNNNQYSYSTAK